MSTETLGALLEPRRQELHKKYLQGEGLAIGSRGYGTESIEIPNAIHVDLGFPSYDGKTLPFASNSQDFVYSSHVLEHIKYPIHIIPEWFRVLKPGGYLFTVVPHGYLYERARGVVHGSVPGGVRSQWNEDHWRTYTPSILIGDIDVSLQPNTWRLRHCVDNDFQYDYSIPRDQHPGGRYEIECIIQKLVNPPTWEVK
jgi:SAM-dependent methyltransferase